MDVDGLWKLGPRQLGLVVTTSPSYSSLKKKDEDDSVAMVSVKPADNTYQEASPKRQNPLLFFPLNAQGGVIVR